MHLTIHALERLAERGITAAEIEEVLSSDDTISEPSRREAGVSIFTGRTLAGKRIRIVFVVKSGEVLTAYRFSRKR